MALEVDEGGSEGGEQRQEDQPEAMAAAHRRCDGGQSAATELARDPGPKPQNEVNLESFLGLFIDPILLTNIWSDIYGHMVGGEGQLRPEVWCLSHFLPCSERH